MKLITVFIVAFLIIGCNNNKSKPTPDTNPDTTKGTKKTLSFADVAKIAGEELAFKFFDNASKTEPATAGSAMARGGKKVKDGAVIHGWFDVLVLTKEADGFHCTTPPNPRYSAFQNFTNDGRSISPFACNWGFLDPGPAITYVCNDPILVDGNIRFFTQDQNFDIWVSNQYPN